ncbi:hypothetical protein CAC42_3051 [Sphaceloma murrayae]|uniref:Uncharacterized protein n=1 Tax=Sphaceloma murrayae TaxID=2082308 RepID=A0A2K1QRD1_9PEZI|nr:hypothetical protein CAC42_3051 [Sphaceloma murrayae]
MPLSSDALQLRSTGKLKKVHVQLPEIQARRNGPGGSTKIFDLPSGDDTTSPKLITYEHDSRKKAASKQKCSLRKDEPAFSPDAPASGSAGLRRSKRILQKAHKTSSSDDGTVRRCDYDQEPGEAEDTVVSAQNKTVSTAPLRPLRRTQGPRMVERSHAVGIQSSQVDAESSPLPGVGETEVSKLALSPPAIPNVSEEPSQLVLKSRPPDDSRTSPSVDNFHRVLLCDAHPGKSFMDVLGIMLQNSTGKSPTTLMTSKASYVPVRTVSQHSTQSVTYAGSPLPKRTQRLSQDEINKIHKMKDSFDDARVDRTFEQDATDDHALDNSDAHLSGDAEDEQCRIATIGPGVEPSPPLQIHSQSSFSSEADNDSHQTDGIEAMQAGFDGMVHSEEDECNGDDDTAVMPCVGEGDVSNADINGAGIDVQTTWPMSHIDNTVPAQETRLTTKPQLPTATISSPINRRSNDELLVPASGQGQRTELSGEERNRKDASTEIPVDGKNSGSTKTLHEVASVQAQRHHHDQSKTLLADSPVACALPSGILKRKSDGLTHPSITASQPKQVRLDLQPREQATSSESHSPLSLSDQYPASEEQTGSLRPMDLPPGSPKHGRKSQASPATKSTSDATVSKTSAVSTSSPRLRVSEEELERIADIVHAKILARLPTQAAEDVAKDRGGKQRAVNQASCDQSTSPFERRFSQDTTSDHTKSSPISRRQRATTDRARRAVSWDGSSEESGDEDRSADEPTLVDHSVDQWHHSLSRHQKGIFQALVDISQDLTRNLIDKETALEQLHGRFRRQGSQLVEKLHQDELEALQRYSDVVTGVRDQAVMVLSKALNEMSTDVIALKTTPRQVPEKALAPRTTGMARAKLQALLDGAV